MNLSIYCTLLGTKGIATRSDQTLLGAPGRTTRSKDATRVEAIATRLEAMTTGSKDATEKGENIKMYKACLEKTNR